MSELEDRRLLWPDVAKALCITLVVLMHVTFKSAFGLDGAPAWSTAGWEMFNSLLEPLRIPLFFAISGYMSARIVRRRFADVFSRSMRRYYYLYAVWLLIHTAYFGLFPNFDTYRSSNPVELLAALLLGFTNLWYLYALALYLVATWLLVRMPTTAALVIAISITFLGALQALPSIGNSQSIVTNFGFFAAAALVPALMRMASRKRRFVVVLTLLVAFASARIANSALPDRLGELVEIFISALAVVAGTSAAVWFAAVAPNLAGRIARLGRQTPPVYVLHLPLIAAADAIARMIVWPSVVAVFYPVLLTGIVIAACLALRAVAVRMRFGFLFEAPSRVLGKPSDAASKP